MSEVGGTGALASLGITPWPIGTLEEVQAEGLDPTRVASCHADVPGVTRGCALWKACPFHLKRYGGFKGQGPRYVPYYLRTHEGNQKEDFMACFSFVRTMLSRMRAGLAAREEGKPHEVVRILGGEGFMIRRRDMVPNNEADKSVLADFHFVKHAVETPHFPRPSERPTVSYEAELAERERARQEYAEAIEDMAYGVPEDEETPVDTQGEDITLRGGPDDEVGGDLPPAAEDGALAAPVGGEPEPVAAKRGKRDG